MAVILRDRPPSDLLTCPTAPAGVPIGAVADIPAPVRAALIRLALSYRSVTDQLARLIAWHDPAACTPGDGRIRADAPGPPLDLLPQVAR